MQYSATTNKKLDDAKAAKNLEINQKYLEMLGGGFEATINSVVYTFDSDDHSLSLISGAANRGVREGLPVDFIWKTADNQLIPIGVTEMTTIEGAMFDHINLMFAKKETLKAQLAACADVASVNSLDILTIWN